MLGKPVFEYSFKRKDQAKTLGAASAVKVATDRAIDPALLFQRLLIVSQTGQLSLEDSLRVMSILPSSI